MKAVEQQIQDTGQVGKMTSKEKVLSVYPDAYVAHFNAGMAIKNEANNIFLSDDYTHDSEEDAWDDAASKLPSAPSPAGETGSDPPQCDHHFEHGRCVWCLGIWRDCVPEPVSTEGATAPRRSVVKNKSTAAGREFWDHVESIAAQVAAPIAPAAVNDALRKLANEVRGWLDLEPVRLAGILGNTNVAVMRDRLALADSELAKPSAEGDGWIAVTEAYPPDAVTVRVRAKNLRRTHSSPYSGVDGEYDGFYDHEEAQWQCYTGPHDSAHLWDCDVEAWLPAPPSGQGEKR